MRYAKSFIGIARRLRSERERMVGEIVDELFDLGPIEPLLADSTVSDILVNDPDDT